MNEPLISAGTGSFTSSLKAISDLGKTFGRAVSELQGIEFSDLIAQQNAVPELLAELKGLLPEQDFSHIEAFINGGNGLPQAAESGTELEPVTGQIPLPVVATLAVAQQQLAAAQLARKEPGPGVPLPGTGPLTVVADGKPVGLDPAPGVGMDTVRAAPTGVAQAMGGFATQLQKAELDVATPNVGSTTLQESTAASTGNPLSTMLKAAETTTPMRLGAAPMLALDTPLAGKGWEQAMGERIIWMLGNSVQSVSLRLNPAHLGPVEIKLSMQHDQASVSFHAQHAVVREALEASIPRLREMFQENNLQLSHVDVGQRGNSGSGQQTAGGGARGGQDAAAGESDRSGYDNADTDGKTVVHRSIDGLLNDYA